MAQHIQIYFKSVATVAVDDGLTEAQIHQFLRGIYATAPAQTRFQTWRDDFKAAVRFVVGRPAAQSAGATITGWHFHLESGQSVDEPEA